MERKEYGVYVNLYLCVLHESYGTSMNDYDNKHVAAATDLSRNNTSPSP